MVLEFSRHQVRRKGLWGSGDFCTWCHWDSVAAEAQDPVTGELQVTSLRLGLLKFNLSRCLPSPFFSLTLMSFYLPNVKSLGWGITKIRWRRHTRA